MYRMLLCKWTAACLPVKCSRIGQATEDKLPSMPTPHIHILRQPHAFPQSISLSKHNLRRAACLGHIYQNFHFKCVFTESPALEKPEKRGWRMDWGEGWPPPGSAVEEKR